MLWPARGVYFFFEPGEQRTASGRGLRVVRVGTHALTAGSKSTLWGRLSQHRGSVKGGGNHRGSIFRLVVGAALKNRDASAEPRSWGVGSDLGHAAAQLGVGEEVLRREEEILERAVTDQIGRMPFLFVEVADQPGAGSLRGVIERNAIGLLSGGDSATVDAPSAEWLGRHSDRDRVKRSGLWNNRHVNEGYNPNFLAVLERCVAAIHPIGIGR
jgi:hypothetical protein